MLICHDIILIRNLFQHQLLKFRAQLQLHLQLQLQHANHQLHQLPVQTAVVVRQVVRLHANSAGLGADAVDARCRVKPSVKAVSTPNATAINCDVSCARCVPNNRWNVCTTEAASLHKHTSYVHFRIWAITPRSPNAPSKRQPSRNWLANSMWSVEKAALPM